MELIINFIRHLGSERGQALGEYGILVAVIAVLVIAGTVLFGIDLAGGFQSSAAGV